MKEHKNTYATVVERYTFDSANTFAFIEHKGKLKVEITLAIFIIFLCKGYKRFSAQ